MRHGDEHRSEVPPRYVRAKLLQFPDHRLIARHVGHAEGFFVQEMRVAKRIECRASGRDINT